MKISIQRSQYPSDLSRDHTVLGLVVQLRAVDSLSYFLYCGTGYYERLPGQLFPDFIDIDCCKTVSSEIPRHWICRTFRLQDHSDCIVLASPGLCDPYVLEKLIDGDASVKKEFLTEMDLLRVAKDAD